MVGGLLVSQALTLFTTPVVYLYLDGLSHWLSGGSGKAKPTAETTACRARGRWRRKRSRPPGPTSAPRRRSEGPRDGAGLARPESV